MSKPAIPTLNILEIFHSLEGEGTAVGTPTVFIRTAGCNVRCKYCDTPESWSPHSGKPMTDETIVTKVENLLTKHGIRRVSITGGEPLMWQVALTRLVPQLGQRVKGLSINLETSGTIILPKLFLLFDTVSLDIKTPCSGIKLDEDTIKSINEGFKRAPNLRIKAVIKSKKDLIWLETHFGTILENKYTDHTVRAPLVLTPCVDFGSKDVVTTVNKIQSMILAWNKGYAIQFIPQMHKILNFR